MSSSSEIVDSGRFSGGRVPERSNFSQTCSLLSQYIKEKGTLGDLNLGISNGMPETHRPMATAAATTMNLFPAVKKQSQSSNPNPSPGPVNFFPGFGSLVSKQEVPKRPENAQMTIFYGGQVIVLNDISAEKAKEVMLFASNGTSQTPKTFGSVNLVHKPTESNSLIHEFAQSHPKPIIAVDLPIARKASLARFLEKRKDRIIARAPYQTINFTSAAASKPAESKPWLGLAALPPLQL